MKEVSAGVLLLPFLFRSLPHPLLISAGLLSIWKCNSTSRTNYECIDEIETFMNPFVYAWTKAASSFSTLYWGVQPIVMWRCSNLLEPHKRKNKTRIIAIYSLKVEGQHSVYMLYIIKVVSMSLTEIVSMF